MNLRELFINYFISKGHQSIPSSPIVPENDASVLFNTAGMQPLIPYLLGQKHPSGKRLCSYQKCVRLTDLEEIGDKTHHTFFEMLGNWSLGDYFKKESITYSFEFLTKVLNIPKERLAITVFEGTDLIKRDDESRDIWLSLGIKPEKIASLGMKDNFWAAGETGPCGPDTEIFYWRSESEIPEIFNPEDDNWVEIWNNVFMAYKRDEFGITELTQKNVDTGMGYERVVSVLEGVSDNYQSSVWKDMIAKLEQISNLTYEGNKTSMRIIVDHIRTSVFIASDEAGIKPSNTDQGYILRRLIRRAIRYAKKLNIDIFSDWDEQLAKQVIKTYETYYEEIRKNKEVVLGVLKEEKIKFSKTLEKGLKEFEKIPKEMKIIDASTAFHLYDTYGFPIELTVELACEQNKTVDEIGFIEKMKEHQEKSRGGSLQKFKGGLAGNGEMETKYHTTTHLLNAALKSILGPDTHQRGSNITEERMRFDFNCDHKLTEEEKIKVEELVNLWIQSSYEVTKKEMTKQEALLIGAEAMFIEKYPDILNVYFIGTISKEICGGPHVSNTNELGTFHILKEEASSAGIRRIKAVLK